MLRTGRFVSLFVWVEARSFRPPRNLFSVMQGTYILSNLDYIISMKIGEAVRLPGAEAEQAEELGGSRVETKEICKAKWRTFLGEDENPTKFLANLDINLPPKTLDPK
jgi:hypothetical protein